MISGNYLGFPTIPANFDEIVGEKYSIWPNVQRILQNLKSEMLLKICEIMRKSKQIEVGVVQKCAKDA